MFSLPHRLHRRLSLLFLGMMSGILLLASVLVYSLGQKLGQAYKQQFLRSSGYELAAALQPLLDESASFPRLLQLVRDRDSVSRSVDAYILSEDGHVLADFSDIVATGTRVGERLIGLAPIKTFLTEKGQRYWPIVSNHPSLPSTFTPFVAAPLRFSNGKMGYLFLAIGSHREHHWRQDVLDIGLGLILFFGFVLTLGGSYGIGYWMLRHTGQRFSAITGAVERYTQGDFQKDLSHLGDDELGTLGSRVGEMAKAILRREDDRRSLLTSVSHDLNTPISVIRAYSAELREIFEENALSDTALPMRYAEVIERNSLMLAELLRELFDLSKLDQSVARKNLTEVNLKVVLEDIATGFLPKAKERGIALQCETSDLKDKCRTDALIIERVISNLLMNAIRHTGPGGTVSIVAQSFERAIEIVVQDSGEGIPSSELPKLFARFQQGAHESAHERGLGGLGLAICRELLMKLGGRIEILSEIGKGTVLRIELPQESPS